MADYVINLTANKEIEIGASGSYYRVIDAQDDIWIGVDGGPLQKRSAGIGEYVDGGFSRLSVVSQVAQKVLLSTANGRIDDNRLTLTKGAVVRVDSGMVTTGKYIVGTTVSAAPGMSIEVEPPAANLKGIRFYGAYMMTQISAITYVYAAQNNAGVYTNNPILMALDTFGIHHGALPVVVPPGYGLYVGTNNNSGGLLVPINVTYEVIQ